VIRPVRVAEQVPSHEKCFSPPEMKPNDQPLRTSEFRPADSSAEFLAAINELVSAGERRAPAAVDDRLPIILVVGAPRSGTTVLMQWLKASGFAVPSNLAARFFPNPRFAGMLQRLLSDPSLGYRDELAVGAAGDSFSSVFGKTRGVLAPHEFSFYFRRFFPVTVGESLHPEQLGACDTAGFLAGLRGFGSALGSPPAVKGMLVQYDLSLFLADPRVIIIHTIRDEADNVVSLLSHRSSVAGDVREWISVRPPEYAWLRELSPVEQVAGQVHFTNIHLGCQLRSFPEERVLLLPHDDFCAHPARLHALLSEKLSAAGFEWTRPYDGPESFTARHYDPASVEYREAVAALGRVRELAKDRWLISP
jgi:hypothetical protein